VCLQDTPKRWLRLGHALTKRGCRNEDLGQEEEHYFAPHVNKHSRDMLARSQELPQGFLQRQE
jgi:hypothetical protein